MGLRYLLCAFFLVAIYSNIAYSSSPGARCNPADGAALFQFLNAFEKEEPNGRDCSPAPTWNQSVDCCSWFGVECDNITGRVIRVELWNTCLRGTISPSSSIFKLPLLQTLVLRSINLHGSSIPKEIEMLVNLKVFEISLAYLSGTMPTYFCNLKKLKYLHLQGNKLTGTLPICIFDLADLQSLDLTQNLLQGSLPSTIPRLSNLRYLDLGSNQLDGKVPSWLFTTPTLSSIGLSNNSLTGPIEPFPKPAVTSLSIIDLNNNKIRGSVPLSFFQLVKLEFLFLHDNELSGIIKWSMFKNMENLLSMKLQQNRGLSLKNDDNSANVLPELLELDLSFCNLTEFPVVGTESLFSLNVSHNRIRGRILTGPYLAGGWADLEFVDASHNLITGFGKYPRGKFDLSFNRLQGKLTQPPDGISTLSLGHNQLIGQIPSGFCKLGNLEVLDLSFNHLTGVVPPCLVNNSKLQLNLQGNKFSCSKASKIC